MISGYDIVRENRKAIMIKNGQSRDTRNVGYTRHMYRTKTNKINNITQKTKKMSNMDPTKTWG